MNGDDLATNALIRLGKLAALGVEVVGRTLMSLSGDKILRG
jgi:hypothetical protein